MAALRCDSVTVFRQHIHAHPDPLARVVRQLRGMTAAVIEISDPVAIETLLVALLVASAAALHVIGTQRTIVAVRAEVAILRGTTLGRVMSQRCTNQRPGDRGSAAPIAAADLIADGR